MRIATWNINSIRTRHPRVEEFLQAADIDVLLLQETKCRDDQFPLEPFDALGYEVFHWGLNQWNGVAILSRVGVSHGEQGFKGMPGFDKNGADPQPEARAVSALVGGIRVWSVYVPNGRALNDPTCLTTGMAHSIGSRRIRLVITEPRSGLSHRRGFQHRTRAV